MGIFAAATLAGFLLFGWFQASPRVHAFFLKAEDQRKFGLRVLYVLLLVLIVLMFPSVGRILPGDWWSEYLAVRIIQDLTGTEAARLILGAVFGCILRYWGPQFWTVRMPPETRYNWVAISLAGLILLAAAVPYIDRQFGGMTGLKTPFAEFQFAGKGKTGLTDFEKGLQIVSLSKPQTLEQLVSSTAQVDLDYLMIFPDHKSAKHKGTYEKSQIFFRNILVPLSMCARQAYENDLDLESIRHALIPVVKKLRLLIQQGQSILARSSKDSNPTENKDDQKSIYDLLQGTEFLEQVRTSINLLKEASLNEGKIGNKCELDKKFDNKNSSEVQKREIDPHIKKGLAQAPHIYLALAYLDQFNDNRRGAISILEEASKKFGDDHSPGILFNINTSLFIFLREEDIRDRKTIFPYLDKALDITHDTRSRLNEFRDASLDPDKSRLLNRLKRYFAILQAVTKNSLAYVSAEEGIRKFEALHYANHNYYHRDQLPMNYWPPIIDTYGYVKMAFEARKNHPNFDEIQEARVLFMEAISHMEEDLTDSEAKSLVMKGLRTHLEQANRLLEYQ